MGWWSMIEYAVVVRLWRGSWVGPPRGAKRRRKESFKVLLYQSETSYFSLPSE